MSVLQIVVLVLFFVVIPLWACGVAFRGDYPGRDAIERALGRKAEVERGEGCKRKQTRSKKLPERLIKTGKH